MAQHKHAIDRNELERVVGEITKEIRSGDDWGEATKQIGALSGIDTRQFGIAILTRDGDVVCGGDAETPFSIQSISKVFSLELALEAHGDALWERVGRDPSGDPFNSVIDLERQKGQPRNPFINAGALIVVDMLLDTRGPDAEVQAVVEFVERLLDGETFDLNDEVAKSDNDAGSLNRAMLNIAKHFGNVRNGVDKIMSAYVRQCAIELSCRQLARVGRFLMLEGPDDAANRNLEAARRSRRILSLMMTCGLYDGAGEFAYRVGLPAKSGIGGGILAIAPNTASIAVWSPGLDESGNSKLGTLALEMLTDRLDWSSFGKIRTL
ncbi:MAG: glutaminase [Pseudomonadota bacterium]|nr:glutaminase [Pseudomonadota bacterium]